MARLGRNAKRSAETHERAFGAKAAWIRAQPCARPGCRRLPIHAAHAIARGMGSAKGGPEHLVPLCWLDHRQAGEHGTADRRAWEARTGVVMLEAAAEYERRWQAGEDYGAPF